MAITHSLSSAMTIPFPAPLKLAPTESRLTEQFLEGVDSPKHSPRHSDNEEFLTESRASPKSRSLSDAARPTLAPSPLSQDLRPISKDDISLISNPTTPQKRQNSVQGLSLQMPLKRAPSPSVNTITNRVPLSPKLDSSQTYGSPTSVLPRRSRGLDFSRACTNLHHSTLAEASPDTSPTIGGRGMPIPQRKSTLNNSSWDSSGNNFNQPWSTSGNFDRVAISSSVSSVNMLDSDTSSSEDEDNELFQLGDREDLMITTPHLNRARNGVSNPFSANTIHSPGGEWRSNHSPAVASLMSFRRTRLRNGRSRHNSTSMGNSSRPSPGPLSPSIVKSIETSNAGFFSKEVPTNETQPRRENLGLGSNEIHLSDLSDDCESRAPQASSPLSGSLASCANLESGRGVIRRPVTRRGNLLPKTKTFARIRAALFEEGAPVDSEAKLEAEVIRQVRESDSGPTTSSLQPSTPQTLSPKRSPDETPVKVEHSSRVSLGKPTSNSFNHQAVKNSGGVEFWNAFDGRHQTPPPSLRHSSTSGEDTTMETPPSSSVFQDPRRTHRVTGSFSSTSRFSRPSIITDTSRKTHKRMRDDDFDPNSFKRRAVSPGMSIQSSPILPQSPAMKEGNQWGRSSKPTSGHSSTDRVHGSDNSGNIGQPGATKRVGLQGMNETNDGLMNMSIE